MIPLCTSATRVEAWGWALRSVAAPCVALGLFTRPMVLPLFVLMALGPLAGLDGALQQTRPRTRTTTPRALIDTELGLVTLFLPLAETLSPCYPGQIQS